MKQSVVYEVSEILDMFNLEEITKLLAAQLNVDNNSDMVISSVDHFRPLYYKYRSTIENNENTEEIKNAAEERFMNICNIFLSMICKKYHLDIDSDWKADHYKDIPGFTLALYSFFILDMRSNIYDVCMNYIERNTSYIYEAFEDRKNKKDSSTLINKKILTPEKAVIISNIYDVTTWILNQISEQQFLELLNSEYLPLKLIYSLLEEGIIAGDFMEEINELYASNISLKSDVCFKIISKFRSEINGMK